jgi:predicted DNA-binding ribbon-helix-helix protein
MPRHLEKRSLTLSGHRTSVALEPAFWRALEEEAARQGLTLAALVRRVDEARPDPSVPLASALRLHALAAQRRCSPSLS